MQPVRLQVGPEDNSGTEAVPGVQEPVLEQGKEETCESTAVTRDAKLARRGEFTMPAALEAP